jgi:hypothetical protein
MTSTVDHRTELIEDLEAFARLLRQRPDMLVDQYFRVRVQYTVLPSFGDEAARIAEVERMAAVLGVDVDRDERSVMAMVEVGRAEYWVYTATDADREPEMAR